MEQSGTERNNVRYNEKKLDRLLPVLALAYIAGIFLGRMQVEGEVFFMIMLGVVYTVALFVFWMFYRSFFIVVVTVVLLLAGHFSFYGASSAPSKGLIEHGGKFVELEGTVLDEPKREERFTAYRVRLEYIKEGNRLIPVDGVAEVRVYQPWGSSNGSSEDKGGIIASGTGADKDFYWYGDRLNLRGELVEPKGRRNPGGFDYRFYLRTQGIDAVMYLQPYQVKHVGEGEAKFLESSAIALRSSMVNFIYEHLPSPHGELLTAILFGQRHRLPADVEENYRRSGAGHLMAVSGLHVGLVAAMVLGLLRLLRLRGASAIILAIILIFAYAYLTGMRPASLRAAIMFSMGLTALLLGREKDFPSAIALAAVVTLIYNPLLLFTVGFQLSYSATLSIYYLYPFLSKEFFQFLPSALRGLVSVTLAAQLGVLPLSIYYFHHLPVAALLFNLMLLPVMALVVGLGLAGALIGLIIPFIGELFLISNLPLLSYMLYVSSLAKAPWVYLSVNPPGLLFLLIYYSSLAIIAYAYYGYSVISVNGRDDKEKIDKHNDSESKEEKSIFIPFICREIYALPGYLKRLIKNHNIFKRWLPAVILAVLVILVWLPVKKSPVLTVYFLDVGQGAATYFDCSCGFNMLIDAGGEPPYIGEEIRGRTGEMILLPFMKHLGEKNMDIAVVTHPHEDHFGGMIPLINQIEINTLLISPVNGNSEYYYELLEMADGRGVHIKEVWEGNLLKAGPLLEMEVISPPRDLYTNTRSDLNNNSTVIRITFGEVVFLITGDIEEEAVQGLLASGASLSCDVLQIPHHGGYLESTPALLKATLPHFAVIQVGRNNFGHPNPYITDSLSQAEVTTFRNDYHGAVIFNTDGKTLQYNTMQSSN